MKETAMTILVAFLVSAALASLGVVVTRSVLRLRGKHLVTCPETLAPAAVEVDLSRAALGAAVGRPVLALRACSRWPERGRCGQPCLDELEAAPEDCQVRTILARWYEGKQCVYCRARFGDLRWHDHKPALLAPDGTLREWADVPPDTVPAALATDRPVCWNCLIVETLHRKRPDLFEFRPPRPETRRPA
jgi:hypothetical protein